MAEPITVVATRGGIVEARHRVHAVAVREGRIVAAAGDPGLVTFLRSSAKPIQALPTVRALSGLADEEIAVACASHLGRPEQLAAVRRLLERASADEAQLETGPDPTPIEHNCSGKHAALLALCRARGWPLDGYRLAGHPCQQELAAEITGAGDVPAGSLHAAVDGCGIPTFALPLERAAHMFGRLPRLAGGARVVAAMRACPDLLRGPVAADSALIRRLDGWVAKGGAEGLFCAASADGLGLALKVEDGAFRAILPALASFLGLLDVDSGDLDVVSIENSRGEIVGDLRSDP